MDKEVLKRQLTQRFHRSLEQALLTVDQAPDGQWIAASEWQVRDIFQKLTSDCYQDLIQQRINQLSPVPQPAFSPCARSGASAKQREPRDSRPDGLR